MMQRFSPTSRSDLRQHHYFGARIERLERREMLAGDPQLIDLSRAGASSNIESFIAVDDTLFFLADDETGQSRLWATDGTTEGTARILNSVPHVGVSPAGLQGTAFNGELYFSLRNSSSGYDELWRSDGTEAGTAFVINLQDDSFPYPPTPTNVNGLLFLRVDDGINGPELWRSDGTAEGTILVKDVHPGIQGSMPGGFRSSGGRLFFFANDGVSGSELWTSDGTEAGTARVKDIAAGSGSSNGLYMTSVGDGVVFWANDGTNGVELWKSDGTEAGTVLVKNIGPGNTSSSAVPLVEVDGTLFFRANDGSTGAELWRSDGTESGTHIVKNIRAGGSSSTPTNLTNVNGVLFFTATESATGTELWKSDGTETGTVLVKDVRPGGNTASTLGLPRFLTNVNGNVYFTIDDGTHGIEVWRSDGTDSGTLLVKDIIPGPSHLCGLNPCHQPRQLFEFNGLLFFAAYDAENGEELWKSDGTETGTTLVKNIHPGTAAAVIGSLATLNGRLLFAADDGVRGSELWSSDGTTAGTHLVRDINPGHASSVSSLFIGGDTLFFAADNGTIGRELWKSDGTAQGTVLVRDIWPGVNGSSAQVFAYTDGILYFVTLWAGDWELWKSDGTEAGTARVRDFGFATQPHYLDAVDGKVFFVAEDDEGAHLWASDGTELGTVVLAEMPNLGLRYFHDFGTFDGMFFFGNFDGVHGAQLWKSDGTKNGTVPVKALQASDMVPYPTRLPRNFTASVLYFVASDGMAGDQLWRSDGTESGTVKIRDVAPVIGTLFPVDLASAEETLYFAARDATVGIELWKSDGTEAGTVLVKDICPGHLGSTPYGFTIVNGTLFFSADDGEHGSELWMSDGTTAGTVMVKDIQPGTRGSYPTSLTIVDGALFFRAEERLHGQELWVLHPPAGDVDRNHYVNARDIDLLFAAIASGENDALFDLTGDGLVNHDDITNLVESTLGSHFGDANLDGHVNRQDVAALASNFGRSDSPGWASGDFNGDGAVDLLDLMIVQAGFSGDPPASPLAVVVAAVARNRDVGPTPDIAVGNDSSGVLRTRQRAIHSERNAPGYADDREESAKSETEHEIARSISRDRSAAVRRASRVEADGRAAAALDTVLGSDLSALSAIRRTRKR